MTSNRRQTKKVHRLIVSLLILSLCLWVCNVFASDKLSLADAETAARKIINPKFKIDHIEYDTKLKMYRVSINGNYMHITTDMKYAFIGDILDMQKGKSILYSPKQTEFSALPLNDAIKRGDGQYKVALFMDMNCSYCHKMYRDLSQNRDITLYVFLYPFMGKDSRQKAEQVWLSGDRVKTLDDVLIKGKTLTNGGKGDTTALDRNITLARLLNIRSTPTLVFSDGSNSVGYIPGDKLRTLIATKGNK